MYSIEEIYKIASQVWTNPEDIAQFTATAMGESGGRADYIAKPTYKDGKLKNRGGDTGLWQIHPMHFDPNNSKYIKNVEDGHLNNDLVDLGIVTSYETAQEELLDPLVNARAADAIARRLDRYTGHTPENEFDWENFSPSLFYGRGNQDFDLFLEQARNFGDAYMSGLSARSTVNTRRFAPGMEEAVRSVVGTQIPIGPGTVGQGEMSLIRKSLSNLDMPEDIAELFGKGMVALLPPEITKRVPVGAWARAGLEVDTRFPFIVTPIAAKAFDISGDIGGQLLKRARGLINGIGNWFVEELGDGTRDPNL